MDSLLVTDLVELSRNGAICDALLLGGDEDLRIGVQIAQSFGVRLHLLGIEPSRASQSLQLRQEVDTKQEISCLEVKEFLSLVVPVLVSSNALIVAPSSMTAVSSGNDVIEEALDQGIESVLSQLSPGDAAALGKLLAGSNSVPVPYDGRLLASCRTVLGRNLTIEEKRLMRFRFKARLSQPL